MSREKPTQPPPRGNPTNVNDEVRSGYNGPKEQPSRPTPPPKSKT